MIRALVACGEVPWERTLLAAAPAAEVQIVRRCVDLASLTRMVSSGVPADIVITSPALRGFDERGMHAVAAQGLRVIVLVDDIRPPWLAGSGFPCLEVDGLAWQDILDCIEPTSVHRLADHTPRTLFMGVTGGVGTSSLAAAHAARTPGSLLIDAAIAGTSLAFLHGLAATSSTLMASLAGTGGIAPGLCTVAMRDAGAVDLPALESAMARARADVCEIVIDGGSLGAPFADGLMDMASSIVIVASGTPLGLARLCAAGELLRSREVTIVVNGARGSALGTGRPDRVARRIVEEHLDRTAVIVPFAMEAFDAAWLRGDVARLLDVVPELRMVGNLPTDGGLRVASAA